MCSDSIRSTFLRKVPLLSVYGEKRALMDHYAYVFHSLFLKAFNSTGPNVTKFVLRLSSIMENERLENLKKIENLENLYKNISTLLIKLNEKANQAQTQDGHYEDNSNAYMYILFVLTFYGRVYLFIFPMQGGLYWGIG